MVGHTNPCVTQYLPPLGHETFRLGKGSRRSTQKLGQAQIPILVFVFPALPDILSLSTLPSQERECRKFFNMLEGTEGCQHRVPVLVLKYNWDSLLVCIKITRIRVLQLCRNTLL